MITDRMSWDEIAAEMYDELRVFLNSQKMKKLKVDWNRVNMKRTIFPAVYSYDYESKRRNSCHLVVRCNDRRSLKDKKILFAFFIDMRTENGTYLVSPCTKRLKRNNDNIIVVAPHALNRFEQRTGSGKRGEQLRRDFMLSVVETGIVNNDDPEHISVAFGGGILLGKMISETVCLLKTYIDDRTAGGKIKRMKQASIEEMNYLKGINLTDRQKLIKLMAENICAYDPIITLDPFQF